MANRALELYNEISAENEADDLATSFDEVRSMVDQAKEESVSTPPLTAEETVPLTSLAFSKLPPQLDYLPGNIRQTLTGSAALLDIINGVFSTGSGAIQHGIKKAKGTEDLPLKERIKSSVRGQKSLGNVLIEETPPVPEGFNRKTPNFDEEAFRKTALYLTGIALEGEGLAKLSKGIQLAVSPSARLALRQEKNLRNVDKLADALAEKLPAQFRDKAKALAMKAVMETGEEGEPLSSRGVKRLITKIKKSERVELDIPSPKKPPLLDPAAPINGESTDVVKGISKRAEFIKKKRQAARPVKGKGVIEAGPVEQAISDEIRREIVKLPASQQAQVIDLLKNPKATKEITKQVLREIPPEIKKTREVLRHPYRIPNTDTVIPPLKEGAEPSNILAHISKHASVDDMKQIVSALFVERPDLIFTPDETRIFQEGLSGIEKPGPFVADLIVRRVEQMFNSMEEANVGDLKKIKKVLVDTFKMFQEEDPTNPVFNEIVEDFRNKTIEVKINEEIIKPGKKEVELVREVIEYSRLKNPNLASEVRKMVKRIRAIETSPEGSKLLKDLPKLVKKSLPTEHQKASVEVARKSMGIEDDETFKSTVRALTGKEYDDLNRSEMRELLGYLRGQKAPDLPLPGQILDDPPLVSPSPLLPEPGSADIPYLTEELLVGMYGEVGKKVFPLWAKLSSPKWMLSADETGNGQKVYGLAQAASRELKSLLHRYRELLKDITDYIERPSQDTGLARLLDTTQYPEEDLPLSELMKIDQKDIVAATRIRKEIFEAIANLTTADGQPFVPIERRLREYFTHIFPQGEKSLSATAEALLPKGIPRDKFFGPISKERRSNREDFNMSARSVIRFYIQGAVEKYVMDKYLPAFKDAIRGIPDSAIREYAENYIRNFRGELTATDKYFKSFLSHPKTQAFLNNMGASGLAESNRPATKVFNIIRALHFMGKLGLRPSSAITNLTQTTVNTFAEVGFSNLKKGISLVRTPEGQELIHKYLALRDPGEKFLVDTEALRGMFEDATRVMGWMFGKSEDFNRGVAFLAGLAEEHGGLPTAIIADMQAGNISEKALMNGLRVEHKTQFPLGRSGKQEALRDPFWGTALQFLSFRLFQLEFAGDLLTEAFKKGKPQKFFRFLTGLVASGTVRWESRAALIAAASMIMGKKFEMSAEEHAEGIIGSTADLAAGAVPISHTHGFDVVGIPLGPYGQGVSKAMGKAGDNPALAAVGYGAGFGVGNMVGGNAVGQIMGLSAASVLSGGGMDVANALGLDWPGFVKGIVKWIEQYNEFTSSQSSLKLELK